MPTDESVKALAEKILDNIDRRMGSRIEPLDGSGKEQREAALKETVRLLQADRERAEKAEAALAAAREEIERLTRALKARRMMHTQDRDELDAASKEAQDALAKLEEARMHAQSLLDLSCADGLYWSWSPTERAAWDWLKGLAASPAPTVEPPQKCGHCHGTGLLPILDPEGDDAADACEPCLPPCDEGATPTAEPLPRQPWVSENTAEEINRLRAVLVNIGREVEDGLRNAMPPALTPAPTVSEGPNTNELQRRYAAMGEAPWFRAAHEGASLGNSIAVDPSPTVSEWKPRDAIEAARCAAGSGQHASCQAVLPKPDEGPEPSEKSPGEQALDEIAVKCGCPQWDYPGQVIRDVGNVVAVVGLGYELSMYAAAINWRGQPNTADWMQGLRERIEAFQERAEKLGIPLPKASGVVFPAPAPSERKSE